MTPGIPTATGPVTLSLVLGDDRGLSETLPGPGGRFRMAVGEPGRRSGVWTVWANKRKSDVYIGARPIAGVQKFSLHESGDWRHQWVTQEQAQRFASTDDRVLDRWSRPPEAGGGWTKALSIFVPHGAVVDVVDDPSVDGVTWLPTPAEGQVTGMHVVIARPDCGVVPVRGAVPVGGFSLANGQVVLLMMSCTPFTDERRAQLEVFRQRAAWSGDISGLVTANNLRASLFGSSEDGTRIVWDLAARVTSDATETT